MALHIELREPKVSPRQAALDLRNRPIRVTPHARQEMRNDGFDDQDLSAAIRSGRVVDEAEIHSTPVGDVARYRLEGPTAAPEDGRKMAVIFELPIGEAAPIITVFRVERARRR